MTTLRYNRTDSVLSAVNRGYITLVSEETLVKAIEDLPLRITNPHKVTQLLVEVGYITVLDQ